MMAAVQPFLSGAISKTINMPNEATVGEIKDAYMLSWKLGLKANALYRDGCKLSQPLATKSDSEQREDAQAENGDSAVESTTQESGSVAADTIVAKTVTENQVQDMKAMTDLVDSMVTTGANGEQIMQGRRKLPVKRSGITIEAQVGNQQVYIRTGEYADGTLGEVFIDMFREGAAFRSILNCFAVSVSYGLQYGVPLEKYVEKFTFTRFEPSGFTNHPNVKMCTSVVDYVFRVLAMEYLGRTDLVQVPPKGTQKQRAEAMKQLVQEREEASGMVPVSEGQEKLFVKEKTPSASASTATAVSTTTTPPASKAAKSGDAMDALLEEMMGDAPLCETCGHITVRNGSCYRCLNCGNSMGCS